MRVYVGYEEREAESFRLACASAESFSCEVIPLYEQRLRNWGLFSRPVDVRDGRQVDLYSNAPQATRFATARFATVLLAHTGWALFVDCDVLFMQDPHKLLEIVDPNKAVSVVKHKVDPAAMTGTKMDSQAQTFYHRKLWSSVMLFNCDHPANQRLNVQMLNLRPGRELHAFCWLADDEIGELPPEWNWLVGVQPKPEHPAIAHYTLGTPELLPNCEHADLWEQAKERLL